MRVRPSRPAFIGSPLILMASSPTYLTVYIALDPHATTAKARDLLPETYYCLVSTGKK